MMNALDSFLQSASGMVPGKGVPLYRQLQCALREAIAQRLFEPGVALPAERRLAAGLTVSRLTVRRALDALETEGVLERRAGAGNFVRDAWPAAAVDAASLGAGFGAGAQATRSVWLRRAAGTVTPDEALRLRLSPGAPVHRFHRLRFADQLPLCLEYATVVPSAANAGQLPAPGERSGAAPVRALQRLSAIALNAEQAALLQVREGDAGLAIERLGFLHDGRVVEYCRSFFRGDMADFVAELRAA